MSGDWIKMRSELFTHPKVFKIAEELGKDELYVVGALLAFWAWAHSHAVDGHVDGATSHLVDRATRAPGLSAALVSVGWLVIDESGATIPRFDVHNSDSAKDRALKNARQARWRDRKSSGAVDGLASTRASTHASTREEKRREEKKEKNIAPAKPSPDDLLADVSEQVRRDFVALRRAKKAEVTETAVAGLRREAASAGISLERALEICCERGWQGFKADWLPKAEPAALPGGGRRKLA